MPNTDLPGFRTPPAWAPTASTWAIWPQDPEARVELAALLAATSTADTRVDLIVRPPDMDDASARLAAIPARFHQLQPDPADVPIRAVGPVFVARPGELAAACFEGGELAAELAELAESEPLHHDLVLDGRAIDVDGAGTALATRQWLLGARNPGLDAREVGAKLRDALDAEHVVWLDRGIGDGLVGDVARFVAPGVVVCMEPTAGDPDRDALREVIASLRTARDATNRRLEVFTVPAPFGQRGLGYLSFVFTATDVLVPQLGAPADEPVLARLGPLFPGRDVRGVRMRALTGLHGSILGRPR